MTKNKKIKYSKPMRILDLYTRFCSGQAIIKSEEVQRLEVNARSIQRDIDDIRAFLDEQRVMDTADNRKIEYDRSKKCFKMAGAEGSLMSNSEILAVSKILLESRAFTTKEITTILDKLIQGCVPHTSMDFVKALLSNEEFHYVELHHSSYIQDKLWRIGSDIEEHNQLEIEYFKAGNSEETIQRIIEPVAILFSEYYFYLNAFIVEKDERGKYVHKYDYPAIFRIDRIKNCQETGEKFQIRYADRFEEGEFRKRIQFMYAGKLMTTQFRFCGSNPEPVLDRLPTARVISQDETGYVIEAEVYGKGIVMWLLSQQDKIEVLRPQSLRDEMRNILQNMLNLYQ